MRVLVLGLSALISAGASGCSTPNYAQDDGQTCLGYGFGIGTPELAQCRMQLAQGRQRAAMAVYGAYVARPALAPTVPYQLPTPSQMPVAAPALNCTTNVLTPTVATTNCR